MIENRALRNDLIIMVILNLDELILENLMSLDLQTVQDALAVLENLRALNHLNGQNVLVILTNLMPLSPLISQREITG